MKRRVHIREVQTPSDYWVLKLTKILDITSISIFRKTDIFLLLLSKDLPLFQFYFDYDLSPSEVSKVYPNI